MVRLSDQLTDQLSSKRLIFSINAGRSGSQYLANILSHVGGVASFHEPHPKFSDVMRQAQLDPGVARSFWAERKLPAIAAVPETVYSETSHLFCKGFVEAFLDFGLAADLILLRRPHREIALSLYQIKCIPARSPDGLKFLLSPADPGVLALPNWERLTDYQLCYWYCLEIDRRMTQYHALFSERGGRVVTVSLDQLTKERDLLMFLARLDLPRPEGPQMDAFRLAQATRANARPHVKRALAPGFYDTLDDSEREVREAVLHQPVNPPFGAPTGDPSQQEHITIASASRPDISTVLLNWNRVDLLARTLDSYKRTISAPCELFIVDNGSTDGSQDIIRAFCQENSFAQSLLCDTNMGGEAFNLALARCRGKLIHLSENDLEYRAGWMDEARETFAAFPELGQMSVFGPVPEDHEVWRSRASSLIHSNGRVLYRTELNVGTASILRRELIERGLRLHNIQSPGPMLFPDDTRLSREVRESGYLVAWAKHHLVTNIGHTVVEFESRSDYYRENYRSKVRVGEEGWQQRIQEWRARPRPKRRSILFEHEVMSPEKSMPTTECRVPALWSMFDGWTAEVETLEFLYGLVRLVKPQFILETGTWHGFGATAMGRALKENGFGRLVTLEIDATSCQVARERLRMHRLESIVTVLNQPSLTYEPSGPLDFLLLDSELGLREAEFKRFLPYLQQNAIIVFHDTSAEHGVVRAGIERLQRSGVLNAFFLATPRGIAVCQLSGRRHCGGLVRRLAVATRRSADGVRRLVQKAVQFRRWPAFVRRLTAQLLQGAHR